VLKQQTHPAPPQPSNRPWIAPEQLFKLTRFPAPMQIHIPGPTPAENTSPPNKGAQKNNQHLVLN
ncbi:hypothetical protein, partial [Pseudarthrobacter sp. AB1]|uniref:hypothetical protein n=1 Tax=Pseudarthrobacter sp. AB1 TaxID=2138309 RepID=UPI001D04FA02